MLVDSELGCSGDLCTQCGICTNPKNEELERELSEEDDPEDAVVEECLEYVELLSFDNSAVDLIEEGHQNEGVEADGVDDLAALRAWRLRDEVEGFVAEHCGAGIHQNCHHENLVGRMQNNSPPEFRNHNWSFPADSRATFVFAVWLGSEGNGAENVHDQVCPEHLHDIQWGMADGCASQNCNEANDNINGNLELQEFPAVVVEGSAPLDRSVDGVEIVIQNNKIRVILGNVTTRSHAQSDVSLFERLGVSDAVSGHSNEASSIFDALN